jgi:hypothetical protein
VVAEAARRLGIPVEILFGLSAHPDLVAMVQRELALRRAAEAGRPPGWNALTPVNRYPPVTEVKSIAY